MSNLITTIEENHNTADGKMQAPRVRWPGVAAGTVAAIVNTAAAAGARALDVSLAVGVEPIPLAGFAQITFVASLVGVAIAAACERRAGHPRAMFVKIAAALTMLSMLSVIIVEADVSTKVVLAATHLIGAALIVPTVARRLRR